jgi:hypothetical protein
VRTLVTGWFSYPTMGATAGDLMARDLVCGWLERAGQAFDVAHAPPFTGGVDWRTADPARYTHLVFVCGPFGRSEQTEALLQRFAHCRRIGLNLSMLERLEAWNPFDLLLERDSSRTARPDITFLADRPLVPVAGVVLVKPQREYGRRALHRMANEVIHGALALREVATVRIDTRLDVNETGLRTPAEVESLIARMDVVMTTRLHGTVLALKNGVPAIVVDPIAGGAKLRRQTGVIGWPYVFSVDEVDTQRLARAFDDCLTPEARSAAKACADRAAAAVAEVGDRLAEAFLETPGGGG